MSGIYGMVRFDGAPVNREMLAPMASAMSCWGRDGHGQWCGEAVGLGQLLTRVTPESLYERLPAGISAAPHLVITADARIDNREELFDALGAPVSGRNKTPDSSLILLAYERWGTSCVKRLLGDFAFAIWDGRKRTLFCARDVFGCRPFVYHPDGNRFIFASDIQGVLARVESPKLNEPLLAAWLQFKTYHAEKRSTFFREIEKLPPAHTLEVSASGLRLSRYWSPEDAPEVRASRDEEYAEQTRALFEEAVRCRLRSALPVGSHLSGGLDSSAISVAAARRLRDEGKSLAVFSWSPPPKAVQTLTSQTLASDDERSRIEAICRTEGLSCRYLPAAKENYFDLFRKNITVEPMEMMAREGNVQVAAEAEGLRVILSGWGGDEAVSMRGAGRTAAAYLPDALYSLLHRRLWLQHESPCIQPSFARLHQRDVRELRGSAFRAQRTVRSTQVHRLEYGHIARRLEAWASSGARHGLVYRYPLLDRRLVEFALGNASRPLLFQQSVSKLLPVCNWQERKREPAILSALRTIYGEAHREWAERVLERKEPDFRALQMVDPERIRKAVRARSSRGRMGALSGVREALGCLALYS